MTLDLSRLPEALRDHGVRVEPMPEWLARGYDDVTFVGQMSHHTAIDGPVSRSTAEAMIRGRPDLPGPLCNGHGGVNSFNSFVVYLIAARRARHAGPGSAKVLADVTLDKAPSGDARERGLPDDSSAGNRSFFGWEWQHPGDDSRWSEVLLDGIGRSNAALAELAGWTPERSIHHREWTRRKIDMSWRGDLRALTARYLEDGMNEDDWTRMERLVTKVVTDQLNRAAEGVSGVIGWRGLARADFENTQNIEATVKRIEGMLAQGTTSGFPAKFTATFTAP